MWAEMCHACKHPDELVATFFGCGRRTSMPGTVVSLVAFFLDAVLPIPWWIILVVAVLGGYAADRYMKRSGRENPPEVVIDKVVGTWVAMYGFGASLGFGAFFLFRLFDILKPFPVNMAERLPGGVGIMADDVVAGVGANLILRLLQWAFVGGGFAALFTP